MRLTVMKPMLFLACACVAVLLVAGWILSTPGLRPVIIDAYGPPRISIERMPTGGLWEIGKPEQQEETAKNRWYIYNLGGKHLVVQQLQAGGGYQLRLSKPITAIRPGTFRVLEVVPAVAQATAAAVAAEPFEETEARNLLPQACVLIRSNDPRQPLTQLPCL